jgi:hypothetical protein
MMPYVLGFTPRDSLVMAALVGQRKRLGACLRVDLPHSAAEGSAQARYLVGVAGAHRFRAVLVVAFTGDARRAEQVVQPLRRGLALRRIAVADALRADGHRWWSYTCHDPGCCCRDGTAYDRDAARVTAEAVLAGLTRAPDRDALREAVAPAGEQVRAETALACAELSRGHACGELAFPEVVDVDRLLLRHLRAPASMPAADRATVLLALQEARHRDVAWLRLSRSNAGGQLELWRHLMRAAPDELLAPPGALTGFAAWLAGHGALAWHAVDRVEGVSPGYPLCRLLAAILGAAVGPDVWDSLAPRRAPAAGLGTGVGAGDTAG